MVFWVLGPKIPIFCGIFFDRLGGTPLPPFVDNIFDEKLLADLGGNHPPLPSRTKSVKHYLKASQYYNEYFNYQYYFILTFANIKQVWYD